MGDGGVQLGDGSGEMKCDKGKNGKRGQERQRRKVLVYGLKILTCIIKIMKSCAPWLNNNIIHAAQSLLKKQCNKKILGWKSTQCANSSNLFSPLPLNSKYMYIQLLHVSKCHWITVSNLRVLPGDSTCANIYNSSRTTFISNDTMTQICSFVRPPNNKFHL